MYPKKGRLMLRISKRRLAQNAAIALGLSLIFALLHGDLFAQSMLITGLIFVAWLAWKVYRDHQHAQNHRTYSVRSARADYQEPLELMSRGSKGLPTNFD
jgi:hypothetical protein